MSGDGSSVLAELLDAITARLRSHLVLTLEQFWAIALWIAHAHALACFDVSPVLNIKSPTKRTGKSRALDVLELLCPRSWKVVQPSEAVVYRYIEAAQPTLLLDEVDAIFGRKAEQVEGLRSLLNAGNARGTRVPRCVGATSEIVNFSIFCAKVLAGIGSLPETVADRSIAISMERKRKSDRVERIRRQTRAEVKELHDRLAAWAETLDAAEVEMMFAVVEPLADEGGRLDCLDDRAWEQAWEPLLVLATLAGGPWQARAIAAARALSGNRDDDVEQGDSLRLLHDCRDVFSEDEKLPTAQLLAGLLAIDDAPWAERWAKRDKELLEPTPGAARRLASMLRPFGIRPRNLKLASGTVWKGYLRDDFQNAWERYAPSPPPESATTATSAQPDWFAPDSASATDGLGSGSENLGYPLNQAEVAVVADSEPVRGPEAETGSTSSSAIRGISSCSPGRIRMIGSPSGGGASAACCT